MTDRVSIPGYRDLLEADRGRGLVLHGRSEHTDEPFRIRVMNVGGDAEAFLQSIVRLRKQQSEGCRGILPITEVGPVNHGHFYAACMAPTRMVDSLFTVGRSEEDAAVVLAPLAQAVESAHDEGWAFGGIAIDDLSLDAKAVPQIDVLAAAFLRGSPDVEEAKRADVVALGRMLHRLIGKEGEANTPAARLIAESSQPARHSAASFVDGLRSLCPRSSALALPPAPARRGPRLIPNSQPAVQAQRHPVARRWKWLLIALIAGIIAAFLGYLLFAT